MLSRSLVKCGTNHRSRFWLLLNRGLGITAGEQVPKGGHLTGFLKKKNDLGSRLDDDVFQGIQVVNMHVQSGNLEDARRVFDELSHLDVRLWNAIIAAFSGHANLAFQVFRQMLHEGIVPNTTTFVTILKECTKAQCLDEGKLIEALVCESGIELDSVVGACLVNMYGNCRSVLDARRVFDGLQERSVFAWTAIIGAYAAPGHCSEALGLFRQAQLEGVAMDKTIFLIVLNACADSVNLANGTLIDGFIQESGLETNLALGNTTINMYGICGDVASACRKFDRMEERNVVSWNVLIAAYIKQGNYEQATHIFQQMQLEGFKPETVTFLAVLDACAAPESIGYGRLIHAHIQETGLEAQLGNAVMNMYGKCGYLEEASDVFEGLRQQNIVSWNTIVAAYAQCGHPREALQLFQEMQFEGIIPNRITLLNILNGCANPEALREGEQVHGCIAGSGYESDPVVETALVNMYSRCGRLDAAFEIFDRVSPQDVVSCSTVVWASVKYGHLVEALELFRNMQLNGVLPNIITLVSGLNACACPSALADGMRIHSLVAESGLEGNVVVATALFTMYGKSRSLTSARELFNRMQQRDLVSWNAIMSLYTSYGQTEGAVQLFRMMLQEGVMMNKFTFPIILAAFGSPGTLPISELVHSIIDQSEFHSDEAVVTGLISMYGNFGKLDKARSIFDKVHQRSVAVWTAMISAYAEHGHCEEAQLLFRQMQLEGVMPSNITLASVLGAATLAETEMIHAPIRHSGLDTDVMVCNALVNTYGSHGRVEDARSVFDGMQERTPMSWSATIAAYAEHGQEKEGQTLYHGMLLEGWMPDKVMFVTTLGIVANLAALRQGRAMHAHIVERGFHTDVFVATALVNMYGKCGSLASVQSVFDNATERDAILWNAMMAIHAQHGNSAPVLKLFHLMEQHGLRPEKASFMNVLSACAHVGLLEKGSDYWLLMRVEYGITPTVEHYGCMVDLLGRAGKLEAAEDLISRSPFQHASRLWITLLSACKAHDDLVRGERAGVNALVLDPQNSAVYVALANIYAAAGRWDDAANVKKAMDDLLGKKP